MLSQRKRLLFVAEANSLAHVVRPLTLARALDPHLYEIHFACAPGFDFALQDADFRRHEIASISNQQFVEALASGRRLYDYSTLRKYIAADRELIGKIKPDLVIGDFRLSLTISAPAEHVPHFAICNAHWSPYARPVFPMPELPMLGLLGIPLSRTLFNLGRTAVFRHHLAPLNRHREEHGLSRFASLGAAYTHGDVTLFCDVPELVPTFGLPENHHYIGPLIWSPQVPLPQWWENLDRTRPTVYLTLGSTGRADALPELIDKLSRLRINLLIATAGRTGLEDLPAHVYAADYLPGERAMSVSALAICNGGSASAYQALANGTPVLGIASNMDQFLTMGYIERRGAGRLLRASQAHGDALAATVKEMLDGPGYAAAASKVAAEFARYPAAELFPQLIKRRL